MTAKTPLDEQERLAVLRECQVLDTSPERAFDAIVRLAAHVAGAPIALVSLVDESRQWFKARRGLEISETPREVAFCDHAIRDGQPFEVPDATGDARFADNPLVVGEPGIRFYYGVPLVLAGGHAVGALCVLDRVPRRLGVGEAQLLGRLANLAVEELEARRCNHRLTAALERVRVLESLLPMCSRCKRVREEPGFWNEVEAYLEEHGAEVQSSLCPKCETDARRAEGQS